MIEFDTPIGRRALTLAAVVVIHVGLLIFLSVTGNLPSAPPHVVPAHLIPAPHILPPPPPRLQPTLQAAPPSFVPLPEIKLATPPQPQTTAPRIVSRTIPSAPHGGHFGPATDTGLGLDVAAASGGGAGTRGSLAAFEAAVRARVLAGKRQPTLAWDRRNTCVVNYRVNVTANGSLAGFEIDPCAIPEINEAARSAIRAAAPFPRPPDLGAATAEVHGSLVFHP